MGVIVNKEDTKKDELSRRINADLRTKMAGTGVIDGETPDLVDESECVKDFKKTSRFGWVWIALIVLAILSLISIFAF